MGKIPTPGARSIDAGEEEVGTSELWDQHDQLQHAKNAILIQTMIGESPKGNFNRQDDKIRSAGPSTNSCDESVNDSKDNLDPNDMQHPTFEVQDLKQMNEESMDLPSDDVCIHVLVVDDMKSNRKILCKALGTLNCHIVCSEACDGVEAVEIIAKSLAKHPALVKPTRTGIYYDIVLMDAQMTTMDGPIAAKKMRDELNYRGKIYGVTGDLKCIDEFKASGADNVFLKPLKVNVLQGLIFGKNQMFNEICVMITNVVICLL